MKVFRKITSRTLFSMLIFAGISYSSISEARLSMFSRANCFPLPLNIGNESISWDATRQRHWLWTFSSHYQRGIFRHRLSTGWSQTWHSAATHRDPVSQALWYVVGHHYRFTQTQGTWLAATNCNLSQF